MNFNSLPIPSQNRFLTRIDSYRYNLYQWLIPTYGANCNIHPDFYNSLKYFYLITILCYLFNFYRFDCSNVLTLFKNCLLFILVHLSQFLTDKQPIKQIIVTFTLTNDYLNISSRLISITADKPPFITVTFIKNDRNENRFTAFFARANSKAQRIL